MKSLISLLTVLIIISSCKEVPTFTGEHINDPSSKIYVLHGPPSLKLSIDPDYYLLTWEKARSEYFTGYKLYRSLIDTLHYEEIAAFSRTGFYFRDFNIHKPIRLYYKLLTYQEQGSDTVFSKPLYASIVRDIFGFSEAILTNETDIRFYIDHNFNEDYEIIIDQKIGSGEFEFLTKFKADRYAALIYSYSELPTEDITYRAYVENTIQRTDYHLSKAYTILPTTPKPLEIIEADESSAVIKIESASDVDEILLYIYDYTWEGLNLDRKLIARYPATQTTIKLEGLRTDNSYENLFLLHTKKGAFISRNYTPIKLSNFDGSTWTISTDSFN